MSDSSVPSTIPSVSRLAPSPTGALHLGNASTFLVNWALARSTGWRLILRIEDLDRPRVRRGAEEEIRASLAWLGIDFDEEVPRQSTRSAAYKAAIGRLADAGLVFESPHSRTEVADSLHASAPQGEAKPLRFPPALRPPSGPAWRFGRCDVNHRMLVAGGAVIVDDEIQGRHRFDVSADSGDVIIWSKSGIASYQLAVVVDDAAAGVTDVVRGEDLLPSAAIQQLIARALGFASPRWWHVPLVLDEQGRRLSKRDGDLALAALRERGVDAKRVIGLVAHWIGLQSTHVPMALETFRQRCSVEAIRRWSLRPRPRLDERSINWLMSTA